MPNEVITLQLGQCGNQVGFDYWKNLCADHGIGSNGELLNMETVGNSEAFFYQADDKRYVPRSILIDTEPRVINWIMNSGYSMLFTKENILISPEGSGAGNNWAKGYVEAQRLEEDIFELIDRMAEDCESLNGIMICHSMAGGTGSGMGSYILECLSQRYPKKIVQALSVFSQQEDLGDVVVQAYNSVLMLERLITNTDAVLVLDNAAFQNTIEENLKQEAPTLTEINALISMILNRFTRPIRYSSYQFSTLSSLIAPLAPTPSMHFYIPSISPWNTKVRRKKTLQRLMYDLLKPQNMLTSVKLTSDSEHGFLAILDIIQGNYNPASIFDAIAYIRESQCAKFVPWAPDSLQVLLSNSSQSTNNGLMISNHTGISIFLEKILQDFDKLMKRQAFLGEFRSSGVFSENFAEMDTSRQSLSLLLQEYEAATKTNFLQWVPEKRDPPTPQPLLSSSGYISMSPK